MSSHESRKPSMSEKIRNGLFSKNKAKDLRKGLDTCVPNSKVAWTVSSTGEERGRSSLHAASSSLVLASSGSATKLHNQPTFVGT
jgi:hypothetical protein